MVYFMFESHTLFLFGFFLNWKGAISPMEISLGVSRFGRRILPPLAFWAGEVARKDAFGNIIEVTKVRRESINPSQEK
jgi:hypothetical protein